jgi:hypothetical protein
MVQRFKKINVIVAALLMLTACDLNLVPEANLSDEVFWKNDQDFRQALNYLYKVSEISSTDMQAYPLWMDVMSDNAVANGFNAISNGSYLPSSNFGPWDRDYRVIRAANNIIEHLADYESKASQRFDAEAKFFRAYAYGDLVSRYGDVPLVLTTLDTDSENLYEPKTPRAQVIEAVYTDLTDAAAGLPANSDLNMGTEFGMVTQGAALALKSRVALREGTWNKFHNGGNFDNDLQIARESALAVMNSNEYKLFDQYGIDSYKQLFKIPGEGPENTEAIWVQPYGATYVNEINRTYYAANTIQGSGGITRSLVDDFLCTDGLPIEKSPLYQGQQNATSEFANRDPRLNGTVLKKGDKYRGGKPYIPELTSITGYAIYKYFDVREQEGEPEQVNYFIDMMLIRYGEVLLNYAEATYELNETISDEDLDISINLLRDRVQMPRLTNGFVAANGLNMRDEIRRERRVELGMEGFRYDDLLRWKTAEVELPKPLLGVRVFAAEYPGVDPSTVNMTADSILIAEPESKRSFDVTKNYLWPLPLNQVALNPQLEQNPNWQ